MSASILIVDDDANLSRNVALGLRLCGYDPTEACEEAEALRVLASRRVDLLLVDLMTSGTASLALVQHVRQNYPRVRIVLTGGHPLNDRDFRRTGASAFLVKPYDLNEIAGVLDSLTTA